MNKIKAVRFGIVLIGIIFIFAGCINDLTTTEVETVTGLSPADSSSTTDTTPQFTRRL